MHETLAHRPPAKSFGEIMRRTAPALVTLGETSASYPELMCVCCCFGCEWLVHALCSTPFQSKKKTPKILKKLHFACWHILQKCRGFKTSRFTAAVFDYEKADLVKCCCVVFWCTPLCPSQLSTHQSLAGIFQLFYRTADPNNITLSTALFLVWDHQNSDKHTYTNTQTTVIVLLHLQGNCICIAPVNTRQFKVLYEH